MLVLLPAVEDRDADVAALLERHLQFHVQDEVLGRVRDAGDVGHHPRALGELDDRDRVRAVVLEAAGRPVVDHVGVQRRPAAGGEPLDVGRAALRADRPRVEVRLAAVAAALQQQLAAGAAVPERLGLRRRLGKGLAGSAGRPGVLKPACQGQAGTTARPARPARRAATAPGSSSRTTGRHVVVERDLVARGMHDPAGQPAGPLAGQVGDDAWRRCRASGARSSSDGRSVRRRSVGMESVIRVAAAGETALTGDAVLGQRVRAGPGQADDAHLRGGVVGLAGRAVQAGYRGEVDDAVLRGLLAQRPPVRGGELGGVEGALQVHPDHVVPLLLGHVEDHPVAQDAGDVDQHVEPPELGDRAT